jgi:hypothetical protein
MGVRVIDLQPSKEMVKERRPQAVRARSVPAETEKMSSDRSGKQISCNSSRIGTQLIDNIQCSRPKRWWKSEARKQYMRVPFSQRWAESSENRSGKQASCNTFNIKATQSTVAISAAVRIDYKTATPASRSASAEMGRISWE